MRSSAKRSPRPRYALNEALIPLCVHCGQQGRLQGTTLPSRLPKTAFMPADHFQHALGHQISIGYLFGTLLVSYLFPVQFTSERRQCSRYDFAIRHLQFVGHRF